MKTINDEIKDTGVETANIVISSFKEENLTCCKQRCIKNILDNNEASLRTFLEEWLRLDKKPKEAVLKFTIRINSHWSARTKRCVNRKLNRFAFEDPLLGHLCRKAYAKIIGISEATLARYVATVHKSGGRFSPNIHKSTGAVGHHRISLDIRCEITNFLLEIASLVGEESSGRHSRRTEEDNSTGVDETDNSPIIFLPSLYSLRLLYKLYQEKIEQYNDSKRYSISWKSFCQIFNSKELSWLRIRSPRDEVCDECLLYRRKIANLVKKEGTQVILEKLGGISNEFVKHRHLAITTRKIYKKECQKAKDVAKQIQKLLENGNDKEKMKELFFQYEAHYSFDFSQSLWLPQLADTPGKFYFISLRSINLFGIVDDGGNGNPIQTNFLYDQTTANKGSSEVVSMLYLFLRLRNPLFASRKVYFHADNCTGQNKNNIMIQFLIWCVATNIFDHVELKFMVKGHTKFSPDGGFGLIKKPYRHANVYTIEQVANEIKNSTRKTERNTAIILEKKEFGNWKMALQNFFNSIKGITSFSEFIIDKKHPLGVVYARGHKDKKFQVFNLLKSSLNPEQVLKDKAFTKLSELLKSPEPPEMPAKKQWDLYEKVRPYVPPEYQDIICPQPNVDKD